MSIRSRVPLLLFSFIIFINRGWSYTFDQAVNEIQNHPRLKGFTYKVSSLENESKLKGSWGDPKLMLAAKNFPKESLKTNETPMTGIEVSISQKIALTSKYRKINNSYKEMGESYHYAREGQKIELIHRLWSILIEKRKLNEHKDILIESLNWVKNTLKVTQKLYSNGKVNQQALFDIQIRQTELESKLNNVTQELKELDSRLEYLVTLDSNLDYSSIPWSILKSSNDDKTNLDPNELALNSQVKSKEFLVEASKLNYIPDLNVSIGYTKRSNIDHRGDFVSATISFPLPFSDETRGNYGKAVNDKYQALESLENYRLQKKSELRFLNHEYKKIRRELELWLSKAIQFAKNSREVASKSYQVGETGYVELLQAELKLQELQLKKSDLKARLYENRITYKSIRGEKLYE